MMKTAASSGRHGAPASTHGYPFRHSRREFKAAPATRVGAVREPPLPR
jgi:hypothetical protein